MALTGPALHAWLGDHPAAFAIGPALEGRQRGQRHGQEEREEEQAAAVHAAVHVVRLRPQAFAYDACRNHRNLIENIENSVTFIEKPMESPPLAQGGPVFGQGTEHAGEGDADAAQRADQQAAAELQDGIVRASDASHAYHVQIEGEEPPV